MLKLLMQSFKSNLLKSKARTLLVENIISQGLEESAIENLASCIEGPYSDKALELSSDIDNLVID